MKLQNNYNSVITTSNTKKLKLILKSALVGGLTGIVVVLYREILVLMEDYCFTIYKYCSKNLVLVPFLFLGLIGLSVLIYYLVKYYKMIKGSGIPQVKGLMMGYFNYHWLSILWAKFLGGAASVLAGLSLGREGPSIQLGACMAQGIGKKIAASRTERKTLIAGGASAGLAAAFNAPLAGVIFSMEEIFKYFSPTILLATMVAAVCSDFVSKMFFGMRPVFNFNTNQSIPLEAYWLLITMGITLGLFGVLYNSILIKTQNLYSKIIGPKKFFIPFICAGILGLFFPTVLCGGHAVLAELTLATSIGMLILILVAKFAFSMISFCSGAPGGIFFPLLIMGATIGAIFGNIAVNYFGLPQEYFFNFVVLAMGGSFTAIVRAPITGIILIVEMTGSLSQLLSLTVVSIIAYIVADLLKSTPIYDSLLDNLVKDSTPMESISDSKITIEMIVHYNSFIANKNIQELMLPENCLLISVRRNNRDIIPKGKTKILPGDYLIILTDVSKESELREQLTEITTSI